MQRCERTVRVVVKRERGEGWAKAEGVDALVLARGPSATGKPCRPLPELQQVALAGLREDELVEGFMEVVVVGPVEERVLPIELPPQ